MDFLNYEGPWAGHWVFQCFLKLLKMWLSQTSQNEEISFPGLFLKPFKTLKLAGFAAQAKKAKKRWKSGPCDASLALPLLMDLGFVIL